MHRYSKYIELEGCCCLAPVKTARWCRFEERSQRMSLSMDLGAEMMEQVTPALSHSLWMAAAPALPPLPPTTNSMSMAHMSMRFTISLMSAPPLEVPCATHQHSCNKIPRHAAKLPLTLTPSCSAEPSTALRASGDAECNGMAHLRAARGTIHWRSIWH